MNEVEKRISATPLTEADKLDLYMIEQIGSREDEDDGISLEQFKKTVESKAYNGKLSIRLPKSLHKELVESAKEEGISLNQFVLYKLAR